MRLHEEIKQLREDHLTGKCDNAGQVFLARANEIAKYIAELESLVMVAAPLSWIAHDNMKAAHEWEKVAVEILDLPLVERPKQKANARQIDIDEVIANRK